MGEDGPKQALVLNAEEWDTLEEIVTVFVKSGAYVSEERKALIERILDEGDSQVNHDGPGRPLRVIS